MSCSLTRWDLPNRYMLFVISMCFRFNLFRFHCILVDVLLYSSIVYISYSIQILAATRSTIKLASRGDPWSVLFSRGKASYIDSAQFIKRPATSVCVYVMILNAPMIARYTARTHINTPNATHCRFSWASSLVAMG